MERMYNPPHPGLLLREWLGDMEVTQAADRLRVSRVTLSRVLNGASGISADMALRLEGALGTSAEMWMGLQAGFDLWVASQKERPMVQSILQEA